MVGGGAMQVTPLWLAKAFEVCSPDQVWRGELAAHDPGVVDRAQLELEVQTMSDIGERVTKIVVEHLGV